MAKEVVACCPNCHSTDFKESTIAKEYNHEYPIMYVCDDCGNVFQKWEEVEAANIVDFISDHTSSISNFYLEQISTNAPINIIPSIKLDAVAWLKENNVGNCESVSELMEAYAKYRLELGR